ncbi:MAG: flagellar basal-body MS-ring/collar protein FliF, partial [bacterium]
MQFIEKLKQLIVQLSLQQKIALVAVTAISLISILFLLLWANRPEYGLLYSKLEAGDAAQIVEDLKSSNITYKLKDGGTTILVPTKDIYELRIKYAGQNLISSGAVGYELFDKNNLGLTEFMQKVNLKRALQGELSKTINQIEAVQQSRVHLVIPEPSLFEDQETKSSASVIVKLKPNSVLNQKQILGITQLVAGSVEGLTPENVIIVDSYGNILTKMSNGVDDIGLSNNQLELKQKVEKYLSQKAQTMLDAVLGENNSIVRVSAVLNFDKINRTSERYDPDNTAILSEERNEERSTKEDTSLFQRENVITNYEINKVVEQFEGSTGDIKQLSIAVFINGILKQEENSAAGAKETFIPRSQEEIDKITENVKSAVGFREDRNDKIVVQQLAFDRTLINREQEILASIE